MLNPWVDAISLFERALAGQATPWVICTALVLTTLLVEDLAIAAGVAAAAQGSIGWPAAFGAVAGGIAAGDLGLYALGLAATRVPWLRRRFVPARTEWAQRRLRQRLPSAVLLARVIPGLRLFTYTACGYLRLPLRPFAGWVGLAVLLWTGGLFWLSASVGDLIAGLWGVPLPIAVALPMLVLVAAWPLARAARSTVRRRSP